MNEEQIIKDLKAEDKPESLPVDNTDNTSLKWSACNLGF